MVLVILMLVVSIVMQRNRVELFEWIGNFAARRSQIAVQWYTLHLTGAYTKAVVYPRATKVDTMTFLDVSEIHSVDTTALVGYDRRF
jgi:hypothetical protein